MSGELRLVGGAEGCIYMMRLAEKADENVIRACIISYSGPKSSNFTDRLSYVGFRLFNAFKRILPFLHSDWQKARKIIEEQGKKKTQAVLNSANSDRELAQKVTKEAKKEVKLNAKGLLEICLIAHQEKSDLNDVFNVIVPRDIDSCVEKIWLRALVQKTS